MKNIYMLTAALLISVLCVDVYSQQPAASESKGGLETNTSSPPRYQLTVSSVIDRLLNNNHDVKRTLIDYRGTGTGLLMYQSAYDYYLVGAAGRTAASSYNQFALMFQADPVQEALIHNYYAGVQRRFSTGTTLSAGVTGIHQNTPSMAVGPGTSVGGDFYQTGVRVELTQDLLKNSFGVSERLTEQTIANAQRMNKQLLKMKLSGLVVDAVVGYWNVVIAEELLQTSEASLKSTMEIRNLIVQKLPLGLAESEDVQDWNGKVLQSRNGNEQAKKLLFDSKLTVARVLNLEQGTEFEFITRFKTEAPDITYEQALKDAFDNRIDWNNQKLLVQNAELEYRIASNTLLPSLKLKAAAGSQDYDRAAYASTLDNINREYSVGLEFMYPLGDSGGTARMQQARLAYMKAQVDTEALELQIRDEIKIIVNHCEVSYKIYQQTKAAREYAQNYYFQVLNKFRRGRYSAIQLKMALDGYTQARYAELQSLIGYNITLLRREFSRNVIFENMGVDIDTILKQIEG